jgi:hypothetical protein
LFVDLTDTLAACPSEGRTYQLVGIVVKSKMSRCRTCRACLAESGAAGGS